MNGMTFGMKSIMNWNRYLPKRSTNAKRVRLTGRTAIAYWDKENVTYLVTMHKSNQVLVQDQGIVSHLEHPSPIEALANHFREQQIEANQLVLLVSRTEVDVLTLSLPPSDPTELPSMVASEVEQQLGESDTAPVVDFHLMPSPASDQEEPWQKVLAFSLTSAKFDSMNLAAMKSGYRLAAVGFRQLSALSLLSRLQGLDAGSLNVSVQVYQGEVELALFAGSYPLILRSVRVNLDDIDRVAEQLIVEVERCITLLPPEHEDLPRRWVIDICNHFAIELARAISEQTQCHVAVVETRRGGKRGKPSEMHRIVAYNDVREREQEAIDPVDNRDSTEIGSKDREPVLGVSTALCGAILDAMDQKLAIDFSKPKRPPTPPNPWIRPAMWTAGAAAVLVTIAVTLMTDVWRLQEEVQELELQLAESQKLQLKTQEKADQVERVEAWLADQVDWLTVLNEISHRLPDGRNATVRRLTASTNGNEGIIDLAVQVVQPEDISQLESQLRSVKYSVSSKRISQAPEASEYPWRFETRIVFPIDPIQGDRFGQPDDGNAPSPSDAIGEDPSAIIAGREDAR
jgi:hypothetical protein